MNQYFFDKAIKTISHGKVIIDVGGGTPFRKEMKSKKYLFNDRQYVSLDLSPVTNPSVIGDAQTQPFKSNIADSVICKAVLQHVPRPQEVVNEVFRILKPGGIAYFWVPFIFPYHPGKNYEDYFRFTSAGVKLLLKEFSFVEITPSSGYFTALIRLLPLPIYNIGFQFTRILDRLIIIKNQSTGWEVLVTK